MPVPHTPGCRQPAIWSARAARLMHHSGGLVAKEPLFRGAVFNLDCPCKIVQPGHNKMQLTMLRWPSLLSARRRTPLSAQYAIAHSPLYNAEGHGGDGRHPTEPAVLVEVDRRRGNILYASAPTTGARRVEIGSPLNRSNPAFKALSGRAFEACCLTLPTSDRSGISAAASTAGSTQLMRTTARYLPRTFFFQVALS